MGNFGDFLAVYSQSYPQFVWVMKFDIFNNDLQGFIEKLSSCRRQHHDAP
jgi:hypothetical protein